MNRLSQSLVAGLSISVLVGVAVPAMVVAQEASPEAEYRQSIMQGRTSHPPGTNATILSGPPLPPSIFMGRATT